MHNISFKKIALSAITVVVISADTALAHTTFQTKTVTEDTTVYNNATIGHGCHTSEGSPNSSVIANSIVFPDWSDAIVSGSGIRNDRISKYIEVNGHSPAMISHIPSRDIFNRSAIKYGRAGLSAHTPVGNHSWLGSLPGDDTVGLVPLRINKIKFKTNQCAKRVTFYVAIADICKITGISGFSEHTVNFWTPTVGSHYDALEANPDDRLAGEAATFTVERNLDSNPVPARCNGGFDLKIYPSASQLNRDMPIPGVWPK